MSDKFLVAAAALLLIVSVAAAQETRIAEMRMAFATIPDFNFGAAGDWGYNSNSKNTAKNMASHAVEQAIGLGDYAYSTGTSAVNSWWSAVMTPLHGKFKGSLGNHDVSDQAEYAKLFEQTANRWYFSFDYQNIHFVAMDPNTSYGVGSSQYNFVNSDLVKAASNSNIEWIIVIFHQPVYTSPGQHASLSKLRDTYHPLFDKYRVDLVLQGHDHSYLRTYPLKYNSASPSNPTITSTNKNSYNDPSGEIYAIVGTGGASQYTFSGKSSFVVNQFSGTYGYLDVSMTNNGLTLKATFYANDGTIKDTFTINKSQQSTSSGSYSFEPYATLTGSNYMDVSQSSASFQLKTFSVAAWFKTTTDYSKEGFIANKGGIGSESAGENLNYGLWITPSENIAGGFETNAGRNYFAASPNTYNDGKWHYVVVTYGGYYVKLYNDGKVVAQMQTSEAPDNTGTQPLRIGSNSLIQDNSYFTGNIDEVRVWNRAITGSEVTDAYNNGIFNTNGQVAYEPFGSSSSS